MYISELTIACEENGITGTAKHLYVDYTDPKYPVDKWEYTIHFGGKSDTFYFGTGCGNRVLSRRVKREGNKYFTADYSEVVYSTKEAIEKNMLQLKCEKGNIVPPPVADVLNGLLISVAAIDQSFEEWCSDFGYSDDSRKAMDTYLACQKEANKIIKLLGNELVDSLRTKEH